MYAHRIPGITVQGCKDYTVKDLENIAKNGSCASLGATRGANCTSAHDIVNERCGPANCDDKQACLEAREETMGYFGAAIKEIQGCVTGVWKKDPAFKTAAAKAIKTLKAGIPGHQRQVDLVRDWVQSNC